MIGARARSRSSLSPGQFQTSGIIFPPRDVARMKEKSVYVFGNQIELPMLIHVSRLRSHIASRVTWHSHEGFEILFLLDGATAYEFSKQKAVELHGGHFLIVPPKLVHRGLHDMRSPCTICGLALKASRPSGWKTTTFTASDLRRLRRALDTAGLKAHPFNAALRWLVRRLMDETSNYPATPHRSEAGIALRALICAVLVAGCATQAGSDASTSSGRLPLSAIAGTPTGRSAAGQRPRRSAAIRP